MRKTIVAALRDHARTQPEKPAVYAQGQHLTYGELYRLVRGFARFLCQKGLQRGDCVVMQAQQTIPFVAAHLGTHLAGGIFTPLEKAAPPQAIEHFIAETKGFLWIGDCETHKAPRLHPDDILQTAQQHCDDTTEFLFPDSEEPAELLFTSGSTGKPKGVLCSHKNVAAVAENLISGMEYKPDTLLIVPGPVNHANGIRKISAAIYNGSGIALHNGMADVTGFFRALDTLPVTALCLAPTAVHLLLTLSKKKLHEYACQIDFVESGTSVLPESEKERLMELLPNSRLYNSYGLSESGSCCMYDYAARPGLKGCIGKPMVNTQFFIVDDNQEKIQSSRENCGCLALTGDTVMMRYWNDPEMTRQSLTDGVFYTTDIGYFEDGDVYVVGRKDDMIHIGGYKVAPVEIEEAAMGCPGVEDCVCVAVKDAASGQVPKLYVVPTAGTELDKPKLLQALRKILDPHKVPKKIEAIDKIPLSAAGKKIRREL